MSKIRSWTRLENAAKIFPPSSTDRDPKVFRVACELHELVVPEILQFALDKTMEQFPFYYSVLKRGVFWYYFEKTNIEALVSEETKAPCHPIYDVNKPGLLFEITYFRKRINLDIFHALADGSGAVQFLRTVVFYYLNEKYKSLNTEHPVLKDYDASSEQKRDDSFRKYFRKDVKGKKLKLPRAYRIRGEHFSDYRMGIIEGTLSVKAVLDKAHEVDASLSEYLIALLIKSIHDGMSVQEEAQPIIITIPVDLRKHFPSASARNFFEIMYVIHHIREQGHNLQDIIKNVRASFRERLALEELQAGLNKHYSLENNFLIKITPLFIKIPALRISNKMAEADDTVVFSNVGKISMPEEIAGHIRMFSIYNNSNRPQVCACSFGDTLALSFSSTLNSTDLPRRFFRALSSSGISVEIASNVTGLQEGGDKNA